MMSQHELWSELSQRLNLMLMVARERRGSGAGAADLPADLLSNVDIGQGSCKIYSPFDIIVIADPWSLYVHVCHAWQIKRVVRREKERLHRCIRVQLHP